MNAPEREDWALLVGGQSFVRANVSGVTRCHVLSRGRADVTNVASSADCDTVLMDCYGMTMVTSIHHF